MGASGPWIGSVRCSLKSEARKRALLSEQVGHRRHLLIVFTIVRLITLLIAVGLLFIANRARRRVEVGLRENEEALRESEERFRLAIEGGELGTWDWDIATGELTWSERSLALFGLEAGTHMTYDRFLAAEHPDDRARVDETVR